MQLQVGTGIYKMRYMLYLKSDTEIHDIVKREPQQNIRQLGKIIHAKQRVLQEHGM